METFFWTSLVAALTGLTIFAYRHPQGYNALEHHLLPLFLGVVSAVGGFMVGVNIGSDKVLDLMGGPIAQELHQAKDGTIGAAKNILYLSTGIYLYFVFLHFLPYFKEYGKEEKEKEE